MTTALHERPQAAPVRGVAARWPAAMARFTTDRAGSLALVLALMLPVLLVAAGLGTDYAIVVSETSKAQRAADAAALAGAKEMSLADSTRGNVPSVVAAVVKASLSSNASGSAPTYSVATKVVRNALRQMQVEVAVTASLKVSFGKLLGVETMPIAASAVAIVVGHPNVCLLALDPTAMGTIYLQKNAKIIGQNCAIFSNSTHPNGIKAFNSSMMMATTICSAGGKDGGKANFQPDPITDCPQFEDPLAGRPEPAIGGCSFTNVVVDSLTTTLTPGTYCGGITLRGSARVKLDPGVYIVKDGPLLVADTASIEAVNASFYLSGNLARFSFATGTSVSLSATKDGPLAGLLFFGSRSQSGVLHEIMSDDARQLLGTIYLPTGTVSIDANQPIADKSAFTAIVARRVVCNSGPTVTLNTNYDASDVPVPDGIRGAGQPVALTR